MCPLHQEHIKATGDTMDKDLIKSVEKKEKKNAGETPVIYHLNNIVFNISYSVRLNCCCRQLKLILRICLTIQASGV